MKNIKTLINFLLSSFKGAVDSFDADDVLAGLDAKLFMDNKEIGWATNVSFDEDFELQGIRTLGYHGDRGYKSQGYNCTVTIGSFVLMGVFDNAVATPTRSTILTSGAISMELMDQNGNTLYILKQCRCATKGVNADSGSLATKNTTWRCREVIPKQTS